MIMCTQCMRRCVEISQKFPAYMRKNLAKERHQMVIASKTVRQLCSLPCAAGRHHALYLFKKVTWCSEGNGATWGASEIAPAITSRTRSRTPENLSRRDDERMSPDGLNLICEAPRGNSAGGVHVMHADS